MRNILPWKARFAAVLKASPIRTLARVDHTMKPENQALNAGDPKHERDRLVADLSGGNPRRLWDQKGSIRV